MQRAVGFLISIHYKFTKESSSEFFFNRFRFDRTVAIILWPHFLANTAEACHAPPWSHSIREENGKQKKKGGWEGTGCKRKRQWRRNYGDRGVHCTPSSELVPPVPPSQRRGLCQNFKQTTFTTRLYKVRTNLYPHLRKRSDALGRVTGEER